VLIPSRGMNDREATLAAMLRECAEPSGSGFESEGATDSRDLLAGRYPSKNVDTVASVSLSGSDSPVRASSTTLIATSSITGVEPASLNQMFSSSSKNPRREGTGRHALF
jgi:hypothetical protein